MKHVSAQIAQNFDMSFLSFEKDQEKLLYKIFVASQPYTDKLIRLLVINEKNCLDIEQHQYDSIIAKYDLPTLKNENYLRVTPKLEMKEHETVKSYIIVEFSDVAPTSNPQYNNTIINFHIISHLDYWELDDNKIRPIQIAGFIHGIVNNQKLSGIGTLNFLGLNEIAYSDVLAGYTLSYVATHGNDDKIEPDED